jgi:hypothetical protein
MFASCKPQHSLQNRKSLFCHPLFSSIFSRKSKTLQSGEGPTDDQSTVAPLSTKFPNWPSKSKQLQYFGALEVLSLICDVAMLILALTFGGEHSLHFWSYSFSTLS